MDTFLDLGNLVHLCTSPEEIRAQRKGPPTRKTWQLFASFFSDMVLLMAEILHHLGCMKPYK